MNAPDSAPIVDLIEAFRRSKTMFTALGMGVFDRLHGALEDAGAIAAAAGADPDAMERLLDACACLELLEKRGPLYTNTALADAYLFSGSPVSLCGYIRYSDAATYRCWTHLEDAVREGTHRWKQTFGHEGQIFDSFFVTEASKRDFLRAMHGFGMLASPKVVTAFDLSPFERIADLGGASGHLCITACENYPKMKGVVFDLPQVTWYAREHVANSAARERIEVVDGDFFNDELPSADLYAVGRILHDWSEPKIDRLLARIAERLPSGGGLLVAEKLLNEDGVGPIGANMQSLNMLVLCEGKERSVSQYRQILERAGFTNVEGRRTGAYLDALLAIRK